MEHFFFISIFKFGQSDLIFIKVFERKFVDFLKFFKIQFRKEN